MLRLLLAPFFYAKSLIEFLGGVGMLYLEAVGNWRLALFSKRGRRLGWTNLWAQMVRVGIQSIPIVSLVLFCIGAILSLQMYPTLKSFGIESTIPNILAIARHPSTPMRRAMSATVPTLRRKT